MLRSTIVVGVTLLLAAPTTAQDQSFIMEAYPPHIESRIEQQNGFLRFDLVSLTDDYFISGTKVWDNTQPIRVCFFGGSQTARARIAAAASIWSQQGALVPLDFGDLANPRLCSVVEYNHIRVGFGYPGYWSTVGTDSVTLVPQNEQSMNLALYDLNPPAEPVFTQVVLHEFGHALGFQHEHQSYLAPCEAEFNWDLIYAYLAGPPNFWPKEKVDHNLRPRHEPGDDASLIDSASIMLYSFPPEFLKGGTSAQCYTGGNNVLSTGDVTGLKKYYPVDPVSAAAVRADTLAAFQVGVDALPLSSAERNLIKLQASTMLQPGTLGQFEAFQFTGPGIRQFQFLDRLQTGPMM